MVQPRADGGWNWPGQLKAWVAYLTPSPTGQAPVFLISLHLLQVGAATIFHFLQCLAPARVCLPVWERFGQCLQPSGLLGHGLLQFCSKQQGFMGWGRP